MISNDPSGQFRRAASVGGGALEPSVEPAGATIEVDPKLVEQFRDHRRERSLQVMRGARLAQAPDGTLTLEVDLSAPHAEREDHHVFLAERWGRRFPLVAIEAFSESSPEFRLRDRMREPEEFRFDKLDTWPELSDLSLQEHKDLVRREAVQFFKRFKEDNVKPEAITFIRLKVGEKSRDIAIVDVNYPEELHDEIHQWRTRFERRHEVDLRICRPIDGEWRTDLVLENAQQGGALVPFRELELAFNEPVDGESRVLPVSPRVGPRLIDQREVPTAAPDTVSVRLREDVHHARYTRNGYLVNSMFPYFQMTNVGYRAGRDVIGLSTFAELDMHGELLRFDEVVAVGKNDAELTFRDLLQPANLDSLPEDIRDAVIESNELFVDAMMTRRQARLGSGVLSSYSPQTIGERAVMEAILLANHVNMRSFEGTGVRAIYRDYGGVSDELLSHVRETVPWVQFEDFTDGPRAGGMLVQLAASGNRVLADEVNEALLATRRYHLYDGESPVEDGMMARVKARSRDGKRNQIQQLIRIREAGGEAATQADAVLSKLPWTKVSSSPEEMESLVRQMNSPLWRMKQERASLTSRPDMLEIAPLIGETVQGFVTPRRDGRGILVSGLGELALRLDCHVPAKFQYKPRVGDYIFARVEGPDLKSGELVLTAIGESDLARDGIVRRYTGRQ